MFEVWHNYGRQAFSTVGLNGAGVPELVQRKLLHGAFEYNRSDFTRIFIV